MWPKKKKKEGRQAMLPRDGLDGPGVTGKCCAMSFMYRLSKTKQNPAPELVIQRSCQRQGLGCSEMNEGARGANVQP